MKKNKVSASIYNFQKYSCGQNKKEQYVNKFDIYELLTKL